MGVGDIFQRAAAGMQIEAGLAARQKHAFDVVGDHLGRRAVGVAREAAVEVAAVDRRDTSARHDGVQVRIPRLPAPYEGFNVTETTMVGEFYTLGSASYGERRLDLLGGSLDKTLFARYASTGYDHIGMY